ncbi:MAG TPA: DUF1707 domain-containing protein [Solirubrobacteraceae bacterium]|nr:DUF1707 domain-containing protein [Solirubrobacteraceae bacterium]
MVRAADQRASDADRDEVVELLRRAAGEGRIGHDELDERVAKALSARTYRELNATVDDIPRQRGTRGRGMSARRGVATWALSAVRREPWLLVLVIPALAVMFALALTALVMFLVVAVAMLALGGHQRGPAQLRRRPGRPPCVVRHACRIASSYERWI